jgi:hypothetical protein
MTIIGSPRGIKVSICKTYITTFAVWIPCWILLLNEPTVGESTMLSYVTPAVTLMLFTVHVLLLPEKSVPSAAAVLLSLKFR